MSGPIFKVTVSFEKRADGGLRAWSDDVPGLILSHSDVEGVLADVQSAMETILSARMNASIGVEPLRNIREVLQNAVMLDPDPTAPGVYEYVAYRH